MKKNFLILNFIGALIFNGIYAQQKKAASEPIVNAQSSFSSLQTPTQRVCATQPPSADWDSWFNNLVSEIESQQMQGKMSSSLTYTIPVIIHIIHSGEAIGTGTNISQAQANSQITILNADYAGTGLNVANLPSQWASAKANTGITWCAAAKDPLGNLLAQPGIDRRAYTSISGLSQPGNGWSTNVIDGTIKPATIWDPTKYCNIWCLSIGSGILGYATFPSSSGNTGLSAPYGGATSDGVVILNTAFGNSANSFAPYNKGRTATHELGHWLGLRHIWGDGTCLTDYCTDTPTARTANYNCMSGCTGGCFTTPYYSGAACSGNTTGEMTMNFMDYTDDVCMYMFTNDQKTRMVASLTNSPFRSGLTNQSITVCSLVATPPVAAFTAPTGICSGVAKQFSDASTGGPTSWNWTVSPSAGVTVTSPTSQNPMITFPAGTFTVSLVATNLQGNSSVTHPVTVTVCSTVSVCDTLSGFLATDSLTIIRSATGYVSGNNNYADLKKGQWYSSTPIPGTKLIGGIVLFYRNAATNQGTKGTATINIDTYNGTNAISGGGPTGTAIATKSVGLSTITALTPVTGVTYCGNPGLAFSSAIIYPYSFTYTTQPSITQDFIMTVSLPPNGTDTVALFMTSGNTATASTAWELQGPAPGSWLPFNDGLGNNGATWALNGALAILPKICPIASELDESTLYQNMAMFPNPNNGLFNIVFTMPQSTDLFFSVSNVLGQNVMNKSVKSVSNQIIQFNLSEFGKGIYFINIVSSNGKHAIQKVIVE